MQPAPGGISGWVNDRVRKFRNRNTRTAAGAYEGSSGVAGQRGFRGLDPDDAWDARVQDGAYEEQELGLHPGGGGGGGGGNSYPMNLAATPVPSHASFGHDDGEARGRPRSRSPGMTGGGLKPVSNPFDDDNAEPSNLSMRGLSPRPIDTTPGPTSKDAAHSESATERRSIFRENV